MGFSDEFIYENYKKYYKIAERAKEEGDFGKMKKALSVSRRELRARCHL